MKFSKSLVFGAVLLLIGLIVVLNGLGIIFNVIKLLMGFLLLYIGYKILKGHSFGEHGKKEFPGNSKSQGQDASDPDKGPINMFFTKGKIDLSKYSNLTENVDVKINVLFGNALVKLPSNQQLSIKCDIVIGEGTLPNRNRGNMGNLHYYSHPFDVNKPFLNITANVIFGSIEFVD